MDDDEGLGNEMAEQPPEEGTEEAPMDEGVVEAGQEEPEVLEIQEEGEGVYEEFGAPDAPLEPEEMTVEARMSGEMEAAEFEGEPPLQDDQFDGEMPQDTFDQLEARISGDVVSGSLTQVGGSAAMLGSDTRASGSFRGSGLIQGSGSIRTSGSVRASNTTLRDSKRSQSMSQSGLMRTAVMRSATSQENNSMPSGIASGLGLHGNMQGRDSYIQMVNQKMYPWHGIKDFDSEEALGQGEAPPAPSLPEISSTVGMPNEFMVSGGIQVPGVRGVRVASGDTVLWRDKFQRRVLFFGDSWNGMRDGIGAINLNLARDVASYKGTIVYVTILGPLSEVSHEDLPDNIDIIPAAPGDRRELMRMLDEQPEEVYNNIRLRVPDAHYIIGHSPITARAAIHFRNNVYTRAKLILMYHVIPRDVDFYEPELKERLPYAPLDDDDLVSQAEQADVVYSVTAKCHWYFEAKFRNRATRNIDHRRYVPMATPLMFSIRVKLVEKQPQVIPDAIRILALFDGFGLSSWHAIDVAVACLNKVAVECAKMNRPAPSMKIANIAEDDLEEVRAGVEMLQTQDHLDITVELYHSLRELYDDFLGYQLCIVPTRGDGYGCTGLAALSSGIPTLIPEDSAAASILQRVTREWRMHTGKTRRHLNNTSSFC